MKAPRRLADLSADLLIFTTACLIILSANLRIISMQNIMYRNLTDKGVDAVEASTASYSTGEELIALMCYPKEVETIVINETAYTGSFTDCMELISADALYEVERVLEADGSVSLFVRDING